MKQRLLRIVLAFLVAVGLASAISNALAQQAEIQPTGDPYPECTGLHATLEAHQESIFPGEQVTYTAIFTSEPGTEYTNVDFFYQSGMFGLYLDREAAFGDGEIVSATFPITAYETIVGQSGIIVFQDSDFEVPVCDTRSPLVWVTVIKRTFLPLISK